MAKAGADLRRAMTDFKKGGRIARPAAADAANGHARPGRADKSNVTGYFPRDVKQQLRVLAAEHNATIQDLLAEALNDLFAKNGKPELCPLGDA